VTGRRYHAPTMSGGGGRRSVTYCVVPADLARALHVPLRRHFRDDPGVEVVVEQRSEERRRRVERRSEAGGPVDERRRIRSTDGRRVADRRARSLPATAAPQLPMRARRHADRIAFVVRVVPSSAVAEDLDTARMVTRIQAGDEALFSELYLRYFERVYTYLKLTMRDDHGAEDVAQQVFIKVLNALPRFEYRGTPFRIWLFVIVRNEAREELRRRHRLEPTPPEEVRVRKERSTRHDELPTLDWINDRELTMFVERLPLAHRQVLALRFMLDMSVRDVARTLDRSEGDVRAIQHRALTNLRERLAAVGRTGKDARPTPMRRVFRPAPVIRTRRWVLH
jgi:RNA polymerase sigma-70 factor, ECF subfamily